ncbi:hypothetical protein TrST_g7672 [Triparma strigata]|uniref:2-dehydropantoate 2-reductase n=2 Tax=Triparma strigata TaxID=1606541 RepID=A0A9W7E2M9_9STRA|nr:hypothetical protein TrST_g7672 [Triparma strigata]
MAATVAASRISIIGPGAVGSFYGARLLQASLTDTEFTFFSPRKGPSPHITACRSTGLSVTSNVFPAMHVPHSPPKTCFTSSADDLQPSEWVVIALKGTEEGLNTLPTILPKLLKADGTTRITVVMNGLVDQKISQIVSTLETPVASIFGCAAYICANRERPGHVNHTFCGDLKGGVVESSLDHEAETRNLTNFFESAVSFERSPISHLRWRKSLWNVPFNGLCTILNVTTDHIAGDEKLREEATAIMQEVIEVANSDLASLSQPQRLSAKDVDAMWLLTDTMGVYFPSTLLDYRNGMELELRYIFDEVVTRAASHGVPIPRTADLVSQLHQRQNEIKNNNK